MSNALRNARATYGARCLAVARRDELVVTRVGVIVRILDDALQRVEIDLRRMADQARVAVAVGARGVADHVRTLARGRAQRPSMYSGHVIAMRPWPLNSPAASNSISVGRAIVPA